VKEDNQTKEESNSEDQPGRIDLVIPKQTCSCRENNSWDSRVNPENSKNQMGKERYAQAAVPGRKKQRREGRKSEREGREKSAKAFRTKE
jgi:hypothetical protein